MVGWVRDGLRVLTNLADFRLVVLEVGGSRFLLTFELGQVFVVVLG